MADDVDFVPRLTLTLDPSQPEMGAKTMQQRREMRMSKAWTSITYLRCMVFLFFSLQFFSFFPSSTLCLFLFFLSHCAVA